MIEALGLTQWVNFPTINKGNTLDLILTGTVISILSVLIKDSFYQTIVQSLHFWTTLNQEELSQ